MGSDALQKEAYHSHLAMVYLDMLLDARKSNDQEKITLVRYVFFTYTFVYMYRRRIVAGTYCVVCIWPTNENDFYNKII